LHASYLFYCFVIYFICIIVIFYFTYIYNLCLTTTRWSWGHKTRKLFCRFLEEEWQELSRLFPESSILNPKFPRGKNLLSLQHSALGVPTSWHLCLVSLRLFLAPLSGNKGKHLEYLLRTRLTRYRWSNLKQVKYRKIKKFVYEINWILTSWFTDNDLYWMCESQYRFPDPAVDYWWRSCLHILEPVVSHT
jgi:hypothetical protein